MTIPQSHNFAIAQILLITVFILLLTGLPRGTSARKLAGRPSEHKVAPRADKASPDNPWHDADDVVARAIAVKRLTGPKTSRTLTLDRAALTRVLADAPLEFSDQAKTRVTRLLLPLPDGTYESFRIEESPIMEFALAQKFPEIKTYRGQGINNPATTTRFDWTPAGFHALVLSTKGTVLIEPAMVDDTANYLAYFQHDVPVESFACGTSEGPQINEAVKSGVGSLRTEVSNGTNLRTYRLAVAATAEYTQFYGGGTVGGGLSAVTTTVNLVDAIYEREVAVWCSLQTKTRSSSQIRQPTVTQATTRVASLARIRQSSMQSSAMLTTTSAMFLMDVHQAVVFPFREWQLSELFVASRSKLGV